MEPKILLADAWLAASPVVQDHRMRYAMAHECVAVLSSIDFLVQVCF